MMIFILSAAPKFMLDLRASRCGWSNGFKSRPLLRIALMFGATIYTLTAPMP